MSKKARCSIANCFLAAENGHCDIIESMLAKKGMRLNARRKRFFWHDPRSHVASSKGHKQMSKLLLARRAADIEAQRRQPAALRCTPLHSEAIWKSCRSSSIRGAKINAQTNDGKNGRLDWAIINTKPADRRIHPRAKGGQVRQGTRARRLRRMTN